MKNRIAVILTVYDADLHAIETPPIWLDIPEPAESTCHWDWMAKIELEAKAMIAADMECRVDWDAIKLPKVPDQQPGVNTPTTWGPYTLHGEWYVLTPPNQDRSHGDES